MDEEELPKYQKNGVVNFTTMHPQRGKTAPQQGVELERGLTRP